MLGPGEGLRYEAGPRHTEIIIKLLQVMDARPLTIPGAKEEGKTSEDHGDVLSDREATNSRVTVARCSYLSPDRPDIAFAMKELARAMARPTRS